MLSIPLRLLPDVPSAGSPVPAVPAIVPTAPPIVPEPAQKPEPTMADILKRLDGQSQTIARLEKELKDSRKVIEPVAPKDPKALSVEERVKELESRAEQLTAREKRQKESAAKSAVVNALVQAGCDPELSEHFYAPALLLNQAEKVVVEDDGKGNFVSRYSEGNDSAPRGLADWIANTYLQTDQGRKLLPVRMNPTGAGLKPGAGNPAPQGQKVLTMQDMLKGNVPRGSVVETA